MPKQPFISDVEASLRSHYASESATFKRGLAEAEKLIQQNLKDQKNILKKMVKAQRRGDEAKLARWAKEHGTLVHHELQLVQSIADSRRVLATVEKGFALLDQVKLAEKTSR